MQLDIINIEGKKTGRTIELPDEIFAASPNNHAIWLAVKQYLAAQRQGTHKVKTRSEVQGSSRKLHKQKGTGGSRKGNIRNPLYKGGGTIFGPKPHKYAIKLNRKVKDLAKIGALSGKASENQIWILEDACMEMEAPKTKTILGILNNLNSGSRSFLFVMPEYNEIVCKSIRNIPNVRGTVLSDINTYDILNAGALVMTEAAAKIFSEEPAPADEPVEA
ncbi:MAG TPA: 50S ribosomal protein L4 [Ginsengibacter sp.]|nr:50S ribosomal protein L4 [Chitinophagaceae bacterium]MCW5913181.1 50S ribosomal protein L4 [Chitinophagaceae bacterium]HRN72947.1 50S ribosomal protein L4 [Ginsengibacter sp.]HRP45030.1 50S ribosomal protein L4 [Ginsengibacter sp.]